MSPTNEATGELTQIIASNFGDCCTPGTFTEDGTQVIGNQIDHDPNMHAETEEQSNGVCDERELMRSLDEDREQ